MKNYEIIEKLLLTKEYSQLTDSEKRFLPESISEMEYQNMRYNTKQLKFVFNKEPQNELLHKQVEDSIMTAFAIHHKPKNKYLFINRPVPLWLVAASFTLLITTCFILFQWNPKQNTKYLTQIDTLIKEKRIIDTVFVVTECPKNHKKLQSAPFYKDSINPSITESNSSTIESNVGMSIPDPQMIRKANTSKGGISMREDDLKEKLAVQIF